MIKRLLLVSLVTISFLTTKAQILTSYDFTGYNGLVSSVAPGWTISNNDSAAALRTYYSSAGQCGVSCPSYKFNLTGATIITPAFTNATQVQFYMKGNGTFQPNTFNVYSTTNGTTWNSILSNNAISLSAATITLPLNSNDIQVKFEYIKDSLGFNVGVDDIIVSNGPTGIAQIDKATGISVYPTMGNGTVYLESNMARKNVDVSVVNLIGKEVKTLSFVQTNGKTLLALNELPDGVYILKITSNGQQFTKRIVIRR